jgi:DNA-binding SARP family transcriptional activator
MLSVSLLGNFHISHNEAPVTDINTARLQSLVAFLILHRDAPQSRAYLAYLFWPDTSEAQARTNLRNLLHHLRQVLPDADGYLEVGVQTLRWRSEACLDLDVTAFETAIIRVGQSRKTLDLAVERQALEHAVALYVGDLLPSCYDDWIIPQRESLRQAYLNSLERLVWLMEQQCDYQAAVNYAQRLLHEDPLREATYRCLMRLHALNDDRAGALRVYHSCVTILKRELDIEPGAATHEAYEQLMGTEPLSRMNLSLTTNFSALVGREKEWERMLQTWRKVVMGAGLQALLVSGEAGIGKTRLVEELLQWAARQGISAASTRCYAAEGDLAYAPAVAWLRAEPVPPLDDVWLTELARFQPEILTKRPDLPRPVPLTDAWQRQHLFEALSRALLCNKQPLLLIIDDLQWCDRDTLEWLHFFLRFDRNARLLVVGSYRPEEILENHPLRQLLHVLRNESNFTEIDLIPLNEAATNTLATLISGVEVNNEFGRLLYHETEGNPLFVIETVRAGFSLSHQPIGEDSNRNASQSTSGDNAYLPPRIHSVLTARLAQLSPSAQELAALAATIGKEFSFDLLARTSMRDEDTLVRLLDELWQRRIVREHGVDSYDFSHDKLREVAYKSMSEARRRLLHRHIAEALEQLYSADLNPISHHLAGHYERAGLLDKAVPYYLQAAQVARGVFANDEAIRLLQRGISLIEQRRERNQSSKHIDALTVYLWEELGDVLELKAQHDEPLHAYHAAQGRIRSTDPIWRARLYCKTNVVLREQRLYQEALDACNQAEIVLGYSPKEGDDSWWNEWLEVQVERVWDLYWLANWPEMEALVDKLQPVVQMRGKGYNRMRFLMASCLMHLRRERYKVSDEMMSDMREARQAAQLWGSLKNKVECEFESGFLHLWRHEVKEAGEFLQNALKQAQTYGIVPFQTLSLTYLTVLHRFIGHLEEVSNYAQRAQELAELAHMPDYMAAAKGNWAWLAWRMGDGETARKLGEEAVVIWKKSPLVYPFQWQALWPLIAVAHDQGCVKSACDYARMLLEPTQQLLPADLDLALKAVDRADPSDQTYVINLLLDRVLELAKEMGYL